jgi:Phosphotransferase enzyme family
MNSTTNLSEEAQGSIPSGAVSRSQKIAFRTNENLMRRLQKALDADPGADLLTLFPPDYAERVGRQKEALVPENAIVDLNRRTLEELQRRFARNPELNLLSAIPCDYESRLSNFKHPTTLSLDGDKAEPLRGPDLRGCLSPKDKALIVSPLSKIVKQLLFKSNGKVSSSDDLPSCLISSLWAGEVLYDFTSRMIVRCSDKIVAKILGSQDTTEYSALQYLEKNLPNFPAPRPHGLIRIGNRTVVFMSYIRGITLGAIWPDLTPQNKVSIQGRLQELFSRLRTLKQADGLPFGGVGGEGVKDDRISSGDTNRSILSAAEFEEFQFSNPKFGGCSYVTFLRSFLPRLKKGSIFTHGDVRKANIMVDRNEDHSWTVTGIIDWEDGGFYPDYFESTKLTRTMNVVDEDDWYSYIPHCIAPTRFPFRWLVDRIWDKHPQWT